MRWGWILFFAAASSAAVYHVDPAGNDTSAGTAPETAWRTLGRVSRAPLAAGDWVLLKRGGVWAEPLWLDGAGRTGAPVTISAYGQGARPLIDGRTLTLPEGAGLVNVENSEGFVMQGLEIRNSPRHGINVYQCNGVVIRDVVTASHRNNGILVFDANDVTIEDVESSGNALDGGASYAGIQIDGHPGVWTKFVIRGCRIFSNTGGMDWNSANGIALGHTSANIATLRNVRIEGNDIWANGNSAQNQAGRGITGSFHGDVLIARNVIRDSASAGVYLGDYGLRIDATIENNHFRNNSLRQFGGFTEGAITARHNTLYVSEPNLTAMGVEAGGLGTWTLSTNHFLYTTPSNDSYRAFIRVFDAQQDANLRSNNNTFFSAGPRRWKRSNGLAIGFDQWQAAGQDAASIMPR